MLILNISMKFYQTTYLCTTLLKFVFVVFRHSQDLLGLGKDCGLASQRNKKTHPG